VATVLGPADRADGLERIGEGPIYAVDALCRRAQALQRTVHADRNFVGLNPEDAERLGLDHGARARLCQGTARVELEVRVSERVPAGGAWLCCATPASRSLGAASGPVSVEAL